MSSLSKRKKNNIGTTVFYLLAEGGSRRASHRACVQPAHAWTHAPLHACSPECLHAPARACMHPGVHACSRSCLHAPARAWMHSCFHACTPECMRAGQRASMHPAVQACRAEMTACTSACMHASRNARMQSCLHACNVACVHAGSFACMHPWPGCALCADSRLSGLRCDRTGCDYLTRSATLSRVMQFCTPGGNITQLNRPLQK